MKLHDTYESPFTFTRDAGNENDKTIFLSTNVCYVCFSHSMITRCKILNNVTLPQLLSLLLLPLFKWSHLSDYQTKVRVRVSSPLARCIVKCDPCLNITLTAIQRGTEANFFTGWMPFLSPIHSIKELKFQIIHYNV